MRPERLEIRGFAPFREPVEIDFSGLDLFALTGPTGAGKSSVIDGITFALYGSVPRYGKKSVSPVVSLGRQEARVAFDFHLEGRSCRAVRVVRRSDDGKARVAEARLVVDGKEVASGAAHVTSAVEALLGLDVDHFTRSVVLPQGEFAAFLHDTPAGQQDLVKALLDMGVLETVRKLASERKRTAQAVAESAEAQLDQLSDATKESRKEAAARLERLERLAEPVASAEETIAENEASARQRQTEAAQLEDQRRLLSEVQIPQGVGELSSRIAALDEKLVKLKEESSATEEIREKLAAETEETPALAALDAATDVERRLADATRRRDQIDLKARETARAEAAADVEASEKRRRAAVDRREELRRLHAVHALTDGLSAGDACPVCRKPLDEDPEEGPKDLESARQEVDRAEAEAKAAARAQQEAEVALTEARTIYETAQEQVAELVERRKKLPQGDDLAILRERRLELDRRITEVESSLRRLREERASLEKQQEGMDEAVRSAWSAFATARDRVASFSPPPAERDDLEAAWRQLHEWAAAEGKAVGQKLLQARAAADEAKAAVEKQKDELERLLADMEVAGTGTASTRLAGAVATAAGELKRIEERVLQRESLEQDRKAFREKADVAAALGKHLQANRFEGWLLAEALASLVEGANGLLDDLTGGAYSLALEGTSIEVVDHRNADEQRSVRSLSGGETFLVSLALALSLGEQLSNLSDRGGARLEAIFLDEGFGSLDAETLETVTVVVTELAAQGRIVGLVTHVKELADQIPVRFEVRTGPNGSTVQKVTA